MYRYLSPVTADCSDILIISPQSIMPIKGRKNQVEHEFEDGRCDVVSISDNSIFEITLQWDYVTDAERSTIFELYHNPLKANGAGRSFYWRHPIKVDGVYKTYTVRFMTSLRIVYKEAIHTGVDSVNLRVIGLKPS